MEDIVNEVKEQEGEEEEGWRRRRRRKRGRRLTRGRGERGEGHKEGGNQDWHPMIRRWVDCCHTPQACVNQYDGKPSQISLVAEPTRSALPSALDTVGPGQAWSSVDQRSLACVTREMSKPVQSHRA